MEYHAKISPEIEAREIEFADWNREEAEHFWEPGKKLLRPIRGYQKWRKGGDLLSLVMRKAMVLRHRFWSTITGADIPLNCDIGGGLLLPHPNGIVIHPQAKIGVNCLIFHQVTIGTSNGLGPPVIGDHVDIGAGAKILGPVQIGSYAKIGANAVVLCDIPSGTTAVGVPTRTIGRVE